MQKGKTLPVRTITLLAIELITIVVGLLYLTSLLNSPNLPTDASTVSAPTTQPLDLVFRTTRSRYHQTGHPQTDGWVATPNDRINAYLNYGPYTHLIPPGPAVATFRLMIDNVTTDNATVLNLDINDNVSKQQLADLTLTRHQFTQPNVYQDFQIPFTAPLHANLEFRTWYLGQCTVTQQSVTINPEK